MAVNRDIQSTISSSSQSKIITKMSRRSFLKSTFSIIALSTIFCTIIKIESASAQEFKTIEGKTHQDNQKFNDIEAMNTNSKGEKIVFPPGYGVLLQLPFGMDIKQAQDYGRTLFPDKPFMEPFEQAGLSASYQFRLSKNTRCRDAEMVGPENRPIGGPGAVWTPEAFQEAQDWCLENEKCTGMMLYIGKSSAHCHQWCGTPQFCSSPEGEDKDFLFKEEANPLVYSPDWNLWMKRQPNCWGKDADECATENEVGPVVKEEDIIVQ